jgi:hypothetical protein
MSLDQAQALVPGIDLRAWLQGLGVTAPSDLIVLDTGALRGLQTCWPRGHRPMHRCCVVRDRQFRCRPGAAPSPISTAVRAPP